MRRFIRNRMLASLLTISATVSVGFFALHILPGDAIVAQLLAGGGDQAAIAARRAALGLDDPALLQYARYMLGLLRGDLGYSIISQQPVSRLIAEQLGATIMLATAALTVAISLGIALGALEAVYWPRWPGKVAGLFTAVVLSTPIYWTGTLAIFVFSTRLGLLPATGSSGPAHLVLPAAVLGFHVAGSIARVTRTSLRATLEADFIRTAYSKGLPTHRIFLVHAFKASFPPVLSIIALQTGFLLGGTVITEMLFVRQGLGQLLQHAVLDQDYPVVLGIVVLSAVTYSVIAVVADLLHGLLDPRVRLTEAD
jgi:peptide/nickel transport system permease protein